MTSWRGLVVVGLWRKNFIVVSDQLQNLELEFLSRRMLDFEISGKPLNI
jgi:hypothetical protein